MAVLVNNVDGKHTYKRLALPGDSTQAMQPNELLESGRACHRNGRASVVLRSLDAV
jgi:hypothetical protein